MAALLAVLLVLFEARAPSSFEAARQALAEKSYDKAESLASRLIQQDPDDFKGYVILGLAELAQGRPAEARDAFRRVTELAPHLATAWFNYGTACFESEAYEEAERAFNRAASDEELKPIALMNAGFSALRMNRPDDAEAYLGRALEDAPFLDAPMVRKAQDLRQGIRIKRGTPEEKESKREAEKRAKLRTLVVEGKQALESGRTEVAKKRFQEAMDVAHTTRGAETIEAEIADLLHEQEGEPEEAEEEEPRFELELGLGAGFDTNAPQSGVVIVAPSVQDRATPAAALAAIDVDFKWYALGNADDGLTLAYVMTELAYASDVLDPFSIQEHQLKASAIWSPGEWIALEALGEGVFIFSGTKSFAPFQAGAALGPKITLYEGPGLETALKYSRYFRHALQDSYAFLSGSRDELSVQESWAKGPLTVTAGYVFRNEITGVELAPLEAVVARDLTSIFGQGAIYHIPYSFVSHEGSVSAHVKLPWKLDALAAFAYEYRTYPDASFIATADGKKAYTRTRIDDRYTVRAAVGRDLLDKFGIELSYTLIANRSTIDATQPLTFLDYDNKTFNKHLVEVIVSYRY